MDPQNPTTTTQYEPNFLGTFAIIPILFVIFYFFIIKPQQDKEKKRQEKISQLKKGDRIITTGGIYANIVDVKDTYVVAKIGGDVKIEISKDAVHLVDESVKK